MTVREYLRKAEIDLDGDFVQQAAQLMAQAAMELEVEQQIGAARHERTPARQTQRNGYRERGWETRAGEIPLRIPKLRQGSYFPSLLEPRRRAEHALLAVVQQAYIEGVSTRKVDDLLQALGLTGIDKSAVSRICKDLTAVVEAFRNRPLEALSVCLAGCLVCQGAGQSSHRQPSGRDCHWRAGNGRTGAVGFRHRRQ
jgi:transposase-like protein